MKTPAVLLTFLCLAGYATAASAQATMETVHTFAPLAGDGAGRRGGIVEGRDGNFYGTTWAGGFNGSGTIYRITPAGVFTILHKFRETLDSDGEHPSAVLVQATDGNFYGTTTGGGPGAVYGTILDDAGGRRHDPPPVR